MPYLGLVLALMGRVFANGLRDISKFQKMVLA